jgi:hypothetical protein
LYTVAHHSSHKAGATSLHEGKALGVKQDVLSCVISSKIFAVLLNQRHSVLLLDEALCVLGVIVSVQVYFTVEKRLEIFTRRSSTLSTKAV